MADRETLNPSQTNIGWGAWGEALRTPFVLGLLALLGAQILGAIGLSLVSRSALTPSALDSPLLEFDPQSVTALRIEGGSDGTITLAKADQGWVLADLSDFPVDSTKVHSLLDRLATLKRPLPIATTPEAQRRHKVADTQFERKLGLESGDSPLTTLFLGDSPGFRRTFARLAGENAVYDLELPLSDVPSRRDDWLARDRLRLDQEAIERVSADGWSLVKGAGDWKLEGLDQSPDEGAVGAFLSRLANLSYRGVLGNEDKPEYNQASPRLEVTMGLADGTERQYRFSQAEDSQDFVLKVSDRPWYFKLSEFDLEGLKDLNRERFLGAEPPEDGTAQAPTDAPRDGEMAAEANGQAASEAGPDSAPSRPGPGRVP